MTSRSSFDSLDHLWADERRLSEAGVRRASNDSTSLFSNGDSENWIIGDRVYVGGTLPGKIAYIGETKFGPGDWAGIVLDEAKGKNDGSVGGFHYFQCEPKHGIFSRLNKISRTPQYNMIVQERPTSRNSSIDESGRYSPFKKSFDGLSLYSTSPRKYSIDGSYGLSTSPTRKSPTDYSNLFSTTITSSGYSERKFSNEGSGLFSTSPRKSSTDYSSGIFSRKSSGDSYSGRKSSGSNYLPMSYSGRESPVYSSHHQDHYHSDANQTTQKSSGKSKEIKIGDRVIISSSQGSKSGVLKFKGNTYFADGIWCGVELDDPLGKNDGSVEGHRYFYCDPKFGVFAPVGKVSKSPVSAAKMHCKNCVVHPNKDIPIVSTTVKEIKPQPGTKPFMDKTTTTVYVKNAPKGAKPVQQIHQIKGYNNHWDANCY